LRGREREKEREREREREREKEIDSRKFTRILSRYIFPSGWKPIKEKAGVK
jgi:hypothetical protein